MAIAKKDRFIQKDLKAEINVSPDVFPIECFTYNNETFHMLGKSNKDDLYPPTIEDFGIHKAIAEGKIGQYIYTTPKGDLYDIFMYVDEVEQVILGGIRTRDL